MTVYLGGYRYVHTAVNKGHTTIQLEIEDGGGELHITPLSLSLTRSGHGRRGATPGFPGATLRLWPGPGARPMSLNSESDYSELYTPSLLVPTH